MYLYITQYCKVSTLSISAQGWLRSTHRAPSFLWWVLFYRIKKFLFFLNLHFRRNSQFFSICASFGNKISLLLRFLLENKYVVVCSGPQHHPAQEGGLSPPQAHPGVHHLVRNSFTSFVLLFFLDTFYHPWLLVKD